MGRKPSAFLGTLEWRVTAKSSQLRDAILGNQPQGNQVNNLLIQRQNASPNLSAASPVAVAATNTKMRWALRLSVMNQYALKPKRNKPNTKPQPNLIPLSVLSTGSIGEFR